MKEKLKTNEGNKLIFMFMYSDAKEEEWLPAYAHYESDWNQLMPVVKKCYYASELPGSDDIRWSKAVLIQNRMMSSSIFGAYIDIVWKNVVEFIQWYNENKKS